MLGACQEIAPVVDGTPFLIVLAIVGAWYLWSRASFLAAQIRIKPKRQADTF